MAPTAHLGVEVREVTQEWTVYQARKGKWVNGDQKERKVTSEGDSIQQTAHVSFSFQEY